MQDVRQTAETERIQAILNTLTEEHLHKVYVYAKTLAQIKKRKAAGSAGYLSLPSRYSTILAKSSSGISAMIRMSYLFSIWLSISCMISSIRCFTPHFTPVGVSQRCLMRAIRVKTASKNPPEMLISGGFSW